ncbi:MAG: hypothetical protein PVF59_06520 [Desulfobacterales bacterium]|jgi:hypothetical protein
MNRIRGLFLLGSLLLLFLVLPLTAPAVDNMMINSEIDEIALPSAPVIGMAFAPGSEPGVVVSLPEGAGQVIPGYRVRFEGLAFIVGVSCEANLSDDCGAYVYQDDYQDRTVYVRYIQTVDPRFKTPEGSTVGERWAQAVARADGDDIVYTANDSCVRLPSGWHACIDLMSPERTFDTVKRRLFPKKTVPIDFYYQINSD